MEENNLNLQLLAHMDTDRKILDSYPSSERATPADTEAVKTFLADDINRQISQHSGLGMLDTNLISDGYHTFGELYEHRIQLWILVCKLIDADASFNCTAPPTWRSQKHSDGSELAGWFILGLNHSAGKQITYHIPMYKWDECDFADTLDRAPEFDGHTSADVLERLKSL